jgi:acyl carrier protein
MTTTLERLRAILVRDYQLDPERLTADAPLESLGIDSLGVAELLFNVEDEFGISLPPEPVALPTLGDVVDYVDALIAAQSAAAGGPAAPAPPVAAPEAAALPRRPAAAPDPEP